MRTDSFQSKKIGDVNEQHVTVLRSGLSVYEINKIQLQLTFLGKTVRLDVRNFEDSDQFYIVHAFNISLMLQIRAHLNVTMTKCCYAFERI